MNPASLITHFDRLAEAPDALPRLRRFILDLAVRGKLVPQDPKEEPAAELLKRIQAEKERLVKGGKIKKADTLSVLTRATADFVLPHGWCLAPLQALCVSVTDGDHLPPPKTESGKPFLVISNVRWGSINFADCRFVSEEYYAALDWIRQPQKSDILYTLVGSFGIPVVVEDDQPFCVQRHIGILRPSAEIGASYLARAMQSQFVFAQAEACATGIAQKTVPLAGLRKMRIPLPPLAEQQRIVAKVEELMALCDRLEAAQVERERRRDRLAAATHATLAAPTLEQRQASFALQEFRHLTTRPEHITQLRQTLLNLAVRGKLVPQDPNDEPAAELLKRIQAEKERLVKEGKVVRSKPSAPVSGTDLPFPLRAGWSAARFSDVLTEIQTGPFGSSLHQSDYVLGGVPVVNPASLKNERIVPVESMAVDEATLERLSTFKLRTGDIVMARRGEMGRCAVVTESEEGWLCGTGSLVLRLPSIMFARFVVMLIGSPFVREHLGGTAVGATMQNLNQVIMLSMVVPLPPLAEQHRIVAKVNELMALCDRLEASLTRTQNDSRRLLDSVLHEALTPAA